MNTGRIERAYAALSVEERVTLQFRAFGQDEEADRLIFRGLPPAEGREAIELLQGLSALHRTVAWYALWLEERVAVQRARLLAVAAVRTNPGVDVQDISEAVLKVVAGELAGAWSEYLAIDAAIEGQGERLLRDGQDAVHHEVRARLEHGRAALRSVAQWLAELWGWELVLPAEPEAKAVEFIRQEVIHGHG